MQTPQAPRTILGRAELSAVLKRLGELADKAGTSIELLLFGGALMVAEFPGRPSITTVDATILQPLERAAIQPFLVQVGMEKGLPADWFREDIGRLVASPKSGRVLMQSRGIIVHRPPYMQALAATLATATDETGYSDSIRLLQKVDLKKEFDQAWAQVEPFVVPDARPAARKTLNEIWHEFTR